MLSSGDPSSQAPRDDGIQLKLTPLRERLPINDYQPPPPPPPEPPPPPNPELLPGAVVEELIALDRELLIDEVKSVELEKGIIAIFSYGDRKMVYVRPNTPTTGFETA